VRALLDGNAGPEPAVFSMDSGAFPANKASQLAQIRAGTWAEWYWSSSVPDNCSAPQKLVEFRDAVTGGIGGVVDFAFLKLCYADFWDQCNADPAALFATYKSTMAQLKAAHPAVTFVHFTVPLWTQTDTNARREQFSNLVRQEYGGKEPVFDIARVESTRPDGSRELDQGGVPALVPSYTDDGGHLNATGRDLVARALVAFLASLP